MRVRAVTIAADSEGERAGERVRARVRARARVRVRVRTRAFCFGIQLSRGICHRIFRPFHKAFRVLAVLARRRVAGATSCVRYDFLLC